MKNILEATVYENIRQRAEKLQPSATRQWGKMDAAQMMAHCNVPLEMANGTTPYKDESTFFSRTVIRFFVSRSVKKGAFGRNLPTVPSFVIADEKEFEAEKTRFLKNIDLFYEKGQQGKLAEKHPGFGKFTPEEWGGLMGVHLNHHLEQFSV